MPISLSGLDLSFLKNSPPIRSPKRRKPDPDRRSPLGGPMIMSDIREFVSVATDKPVRITSRSQLAAYERSNNIRQCGDYKPGEVVRREKRRVNAPIEAAKKVKGVKVDVSWV